MIEIVDQTIKKHDVRRKCHVYFKLCSFRKPVDSLPFFYSYSIVAITHLYHFVGALLIGLLLPSTDELLASGQRILPCSSGMHRRDRR